MLNPEQNVQIVRLRSGEDIIANCIPNLEKSTVELKKPMHLIFKRVQIGRSMMMMMPWLPIELIKENTAHIFCTDILTFINPKDEMIQYYNDAVNNENLESMATNSIDQSFDDDEEPTNGELDEEEMQELIEEQKKHTVH